MRIRIYKLTPYYNVDAYFTDIPGAPSLDPKHPVTYPGAEVKLIEVLDSDDALRKYGKEQICSSNVLYSTSRDGKIAIWEMTGRTSADVLLEHA